MLSFLPQGYNLRNWFKPETNEIYIIDRHFEIVHVRKLTQKSACYSWSSCNGICLVSEPDICTLYKYSILMLICISQKYIPVHLFQT